MAFQRMTGNQRNQINTLRDRAWAAGLTDATFSQIASRPADWEAQIAAAEQAQAAAEREAAEAATREAEETADASAIITALRAAGMTARQIAQAVGVHVSTVYRWARGLFRPAAFRLATLATLAA